MKNIKLFTQYLDYFNHPQLGKQYIHIAGTKGKTSVAYYMYQLFLLQNKKVGLFVSPHVFKERERVQYTGEYITKEELSFYRSQIKRAEEILKEKLNFFEEFLLIAFLFFKDKPAEYIIIEVGIGGLYDTTNIISPVLSLISRIQKDHQEILGHSLWAMFKQKMGIIKPKVDFIIGKQSLLGRVYTFFLLGKSLYKKRQLPYKIISIHGLSIVIEIEKKFIELKGPYFMVENFALAYSALRALGICLNISLFLHQVPGRYQSVPFMPYTYLDGAHNPIAIKFLVQSLKLQFPRALWKIVLCIRADKEMAPMLKLLKPITKEIFLLPWDKEIDEPFNPKKLIESLSQEKIKYQYLPTDSLKKSLSVDDHILVTGSFYHLKMMYSLLDSYKEL